MCMCMMHITLTYTPCPMLQQDTFILATLLFMYLLPVFASFLASHIIAQTHTRHTHTTQK